ncbi:MAG: hypothetical protein JNJ82_05320 [Opitutaceae bacterium]|nr:hypothetical protein [Opitutaceae bacterium]
MNARTGNRLAVELVDRAIRVQLEVNDLTARWMAADAAEDIAFLDRLENALRRFASIREFLESLGTPVPNIFTHPDTMRKILPRVFEERSGFRACWKN